MRIATWNVERLKHKKDLEKIKKICNDLNADIFVLTETDERIKLNHKNFFQTPKLTDKNFYKPTENRVSIFTKMRRKAPVFRRGDIRRKKNIAL